ncbi:MAG: RNA 2',3'-cyclic phosphodiesterase [Terracidiphilus sp.]|jgi:2'-5' RNA ligase
MRLFVGIPLADEVVRELAAVVARLRRAEGAGNGGRMRWTAPESWHITLEFLGNATEEQFECLKARLGEVRSVPAPVRLSELGCFERAGVFFADVDVTPELSALQRKVVAATSRCGFVAEARAFRPHITLARKPGNKGPREQGNKKPNPLAQVGNVGRSGALRELTIRAGRGPAFTRFTAREFRLYESHLEPGGARYEVRMRVPLEGA